MPWSYLRRDTWVPTRGARSISPSCLSRASASRTVLRDTPKSAASSDSDGNPRSAKESAWIC